MGDSSLDACCRLSAGTSRLLSDLSRDGQHGETRGGLSNARCLIACKCGGESLGNISTKIGLEWEIFPPHPLPSVEIALASWSDSVASYPRYRLIG